MISNDVQSSIKVPQKIILITCNDKIVHMYIRYKKILFIIYLFIYLFIFSSDQSHPNNADLFLLLLNNTSRSLRKEFELQTNKSTVMAHRYQRNTNNQTIPISDSARTSFDSQQFSPEERVKLFIFNKNKSFIV